MARPDAGVWRDRDSELISHAYSRYSDLVVEEAEGAHLHTVDGRDILDFGCGIGVTNLGHRHPAVTAAVHAQVDRLWHTSVTSLHTTMIDAAAALTAVTPDTLDQVFFTNSGAEAVEGAIKLARRATGRSEIIAFWGAFHGRTYGALTLTASRAKYRNRMGPFLPGVHHVRYPYELLYCTHPRDEVCPIAAGEEIEQLFRTTVPPESVAAIVVEPIQGEGGFVVPPPAFMPALRRICDEHGILLVADEVQSGMARSGRMFAVEHTRTVPDIMCLAKALANGLPLAAVVAKHSVMQAWQPGEHGTTFGGNPVACAALSAVLDVMQREHIPERSMRLGAEVQRRAREWRQTAPLLVDVRGSGLMVGMEFARERRPAADVVERIRERALADGLLLLSCGTADNVIRVMPPLTIPEDELHAGLDIIEAAVKAEAR